MRFISVSADFDSPTDSAVRFELTRLLRVLCSFSIRRCCMAGSTLITHCGGREVSREELDSFEAPPPTDTWFPLAHCEVLDTACETLRGAGFEIRSSRLSVSHGQNRFFGVLDL